MSHPILTDAATKMKKSVDFTLHEFSAIHTGKATPAMVEGVQVEAYGSMMRLKECAAISTPDARLIQIQPWDAGLTKAIAGAYAHSLGEAKAAAKAKQWQTALDAYTAAYGFKPTDEAQKGIADMKKKLGQ